jgi:glutathione S-transferase
MYTLFHFPYSQHARRVVSLLEECQLPYRLQHVAMDKGEHVSSEFLAINPNHQVPVLQDDDFLVYESNAILRYICNKHELTNWYPTDIRSRARVDQWLDWNQCRLSPSVIDIVFNKVFAGDKGDAKAIERGSKSMEELLPILEVQLQYSPYLVGDRPTIADLSVVSNLFQLGLADVKPPETTTNWVRRLLSLSGVKKSLPPQ